MALLDDNLRRRLSPMDWQEIESDPPVYAKVVFPKERTLYIMAGEPVGNDYVLFAFVSGFGQPATFHVSELEALGAERDKAFREGRFTDVVPAPDS